MSRSCIPWLPVTIRVKTSTPAWSRTACTLAADRVPIFDPAARAHRRTNQYRRSLVKHDQTSPLGLPPAPPTMRPPRRSLLPTFTGDASHQFRLPTAAMATGHFCRLHRTRPDDRWGVVPNQWLLRGRDRAAQCSGFAASSNPGREGCASIYLSCVVLFGAYPPCQAG